MTTWFRDQRLEAVRSVVRDSGARTVLDLGCGDGELLTRLEAEPQIERIVGVDVDHDALGRLRLPPDSLERMAWQRSTSSTAR